MAIQLPVLEQGGLPQLLSCQQGKGCIRQDLDESARVPARRLAGKLTVLQVCSAVSTGAHTVSSDVILALDLLDGGAVAVLGASGYYTADLDTEQHIRWLIRQGCNLGAIATAVNRKADQRQGSLGHFVLLGDPALVPEGWLLNAAECKTDPVRPRGESTTGESSEASTARLRRVASQVLPALDRLSWLGLDPDPALTTAVRSELAAAWESSRQDQGTTGADLAELEEALGRVHRQLVTSMGETARNSWWSFGGSPADLQELGLAERTCSGCGREARLVQYAHRLIDLARFTVQVCPHCGPTTWATGETSSVVARHGRTESSHYVGDLVALPLELANHSQSPVSVVVGGAVVAGTQYGFKAVPMQEVTIAPLSTVIISVSFDCRERGLLADQYEFAIFWCVDGEVNLNLHMVWLRDRSAVGGSAWEL